MAENIVIAIDVGSTSIKAGAYGYSGNNISQTLEVITESYPEDAFETLESHGYHQMNFTLVMETIQRCLQRLKYTYRIRAKKLGICGQMHGIIFWNEDESRSSHNYHHPWQYDPVAGQFIIDHRRFSPYITWQDSRCNQEFIEKLVADNYIAAEMELSSSSGSDRKSPMPDTSCGQLSSGYGLTTGLWFVRNDKKYLRNFNRCGTPMTVILMMLSSDNQTLEDEAMMDRDSSERHVQDVEARYMEDSIHSYAVSDQIAASWGFYNLEGSSWRTASLRRLGFPIAKVNDKYKEEEGTETQEPKQKNLIKLPKILPAGTSLGPSRTRWLLIPKGVQLFVECGDMQCGARVCLSHRSNTAIMNLSTSIQLAIVSSEIPEREFINSYPGLNIVPYLDGRYLLVAASLNGGRVIQKFVEFIHDVSIKTTNAKTLRLEDTWGALFACSDVTTPSLEINPCIFGERHDTSLAGSVSNIKSDNFSLSNIMSSLCHGILNNILSMMPVEILKANGIDQLVCVGSVIRKNPIMRTIIEATFRRQNIRVTFLMAADAQEGAAMNTLSEAL